VARLPAASLKRSIGLKDEAEPLGDRRNHRSTALSSEPGGTRLPRAELSPSARERTGESQSDPRSWSLPEASEILSAPQRSACGHAMIKPFYWYFELARWLRVLCCYLTGTRSRTRTGVDRVAPARAASTQSASRTACARSLS